MKTKEIGELNERLELVEQIISEREEVFIDAVKAAVEKANETPVDKRKKRKKAKQYLTPSPNQHQRESHQPNPGHDHHKHQEHQGQHGSDHSESEVALTAEEIFKLYEGRDLCDKLN